MRTSAWLIGLSVVVVGACVPSAGPAPRVDLRRVAAEVVATAAARPSAVPAVGAEAVPAPESTVAPAEALPTPSIAPTSTVAAATAAPTSTAVAPTATAIPPPSPAPTEPPAAPATGAAPTPSPNAGELAPGGTFARFGFDYPGDRSVFTVNLHVEPDDAGVLKNAGFVIYGPGGEEIVRGGAQPGRRPNVSADVIH